jgi:hypothetical protein
MTLLRCVVIAAALGFVACDSESDSHESDDDGGTSDASAAGTAAKSGSSGSGGRTAGKAGAGGAGAGQSGGGGGGKAGGAGAAGSAGGSAGSAGSAGAAGSIAGAGGSTNNGTIDVAATVIEIERPWVAVDSPCTIAEGDVNPAPQRSDAWITADGSALYRTKWTTQAGYAGIRTCAGDREWSFQDKAVAANVQWVVDSNSLFQAWPTTDPTTSLHSLATARDNVSGARVWEDSFATAMSPVAITHVEAKGDHMYVIGTSAQLPGMAPPPGGNAVFSAHYDAATGKQDWLRQEVANDPFTVVRVTAIDDDGNLYEADPSFGGSIAQIKIQKLNSHGERVWLTSTKLRVSASSVGQTRLYVSGDGESIFACWAGYVAKFDANGQHEWSQFITTEHSVVIDEVEKTTWVGKGTIKFLTASEDAVYLVGDYANTYMLGANPPPAFSGIAVVKLDYAGKLQWAKQYRVNPLTVGAGKSGSATSNGVAAARATDDGDLALTASLAGTNSKYETIRIGPDGMPK